MALTGNFDLYYLIVELVFGNLLAAFIGIIVAILIIGIITRTSMLTTSYIILIFSFTYLSFCYGGIIIAIGFILSMGYMWWSISKWLKESAG